MHIPNGAEVQVLTDTGVADAVEVSLHIEPEHGNRQVVTLYTQAGIHEFVKSIVNDVKKSSVRGLVK